MLQEVQKIKQNELSSNIDEVGCNIKGEEDSNYDFPNTGKVGEYNRNRSLFGVQLLVCSILLWSLLFVKESNYGKVYLGMITQVITKDIEIELVQQAINELTIAIQQLI